MRFRRSPHHLLENIRLASISCTRERNQYIFAFPRFRANLKMKQQKKKSLTFRMIILRGSFGRPIARLAIAFVRIGFCPITAKEKEKSTYVKGLNQTNRYLIFWRMPMIFALSGKNKEIIIQMGKITHKGCREGLTWD